MPAAAEAIVRPVLPPRREGPVSRRCWKCMAGHGRRATGSTTSPIGEDLAANGIVMLSIDFRMPPVARYPGTVADVNFGDPIFEGERRAVRNPRRSGRRSRYILRRPSVAAQCDAAARSALYLAAARWRRCPLAFAVACWPVADPLARYRAVRERGNDRLVEAHISSGRPRRRWQRAARS